MSHDYSQITESPGLHATREQLERIYHRYHFARQFCEGGDVVEVACGTGMGLGYLASFSRSVLGGDIDEKNLQTARQLYKDRPEIKVEKMDAHHLTLSNDSCEAILLFEAIYYLQQPEKFIEESRRVLKAGGHLVICTVNRAWKDFHPSPFVHRYFTAAELDKMLNDVFSNVKIYGAFRIKKGVKAAIFSLIKRGAVKMSLIPGSLKLRAILKNVFMGKTFPLPKNVTEGMTHYDPPEQVTDFKEASQYKILYAVAVKE